MDAEIKAKWLAMLRDPQYKQATARLVLTDPVSGTVSYCCIGLLALATGAKHRPGDRMVWDGPQDPPNAGFTSLPISILRKIDLSFENERHAIVMNDADRASFSKIATFVETL